MRPPGGTGEGWERPREARPPAAGTRALTQSVWPGPRHLFPPGPRGWECLLAAIPLLPAVKFPRLGLPGDPGLCPGKPRRAAAVKAKAGGGAREEPGSRARPLTRAPGSCCPVPPERCRRPTAGASAGDERAAAGAQGGSESGTRIPGVRPGVCSVGLSRSGSPAAPRLLSGFRAMGGGQATNGDPAGGLAARPTHLPAAWPGGAAGPQRRSRLLSAQRSGLAGALYRAHRALRAHTHSPHTHVERRPSAAAHNVGAPPVTRRRAALFGCVPEIRCLRPAKVIAG